MPHLTPLDSRGHVHIAIFRSVQRFLLERRVAMTVLRQSLHYLDNLVQHGTPHNAHVDNVSRSSNETDSFPGVVVAAGLTMLLIFLPLIWHHVTRRASANRRQRSSRDVQNDHVSNSGLATTTFVVQPSGIAITVRTMGPAIPQLAAVAAAEAAQDQSGRLRKFVKLQGFDPPKDIGDTVCAICLSPLSEQLISNAACAHIFHTECYNSWLVKDRKRSCPICREPVDSRPSSSPSVATFLSGTNFSTTSDCQNSSQL